MKDLDIRGAGNLLGGEQSGVIADIGFDMYQKILKEGIDELRQYEFKDLFENRNSDSYQQFIQECVLETDMEIRILDVYVINVSERLSLYQKLNSLQTEAELTLLESQLIDRFGPIPAIVEDLL